MGDDITGLSSVDLGAQIRARAVSCREVMTAYLDRIERLNPHVNAIVALQDREDLIAAADRADAAVVSGRPLGPLHGLPLAIKDLAPARGLPFTMGSPIFRNVVAETDSIPVARMRAAGGIIIGKTNTPEFGLGSHTYNPVWGVTRNPYDLRVSAGGSSGGAAAALASRLLPVADGSDYGGSLRNPAGWNAVFGFRPSFGRTPVEALDAWIPSMGVTGPMARSMADLALLMDVLCGYDPRAPLSREAPPVPFSDLPPRPARGLRLAWSGDLGGAAPCEPGVLEVCESALGKLSAAGVEIVSQQPHYPAERAWSAFKDIRAWQVGYSLIEHYRDPERRALLKPEAVSEVARGLELDAFAVSAQSRVRTEWSTAVATLLGSVDAWILPSAQVLPFPVERTWPGDILGTRMSSYHEWMKANCLVSLSGCPALAAPAGFVPSGLPVGVQIVTAPGRDADAFAIGNLWQEVVGPSAMRRPPEPDGA